MLDETHLWNSSIGLRYVLRIRNTLCAVGSCLSFLYHIYSSADVKLTLPPPPPFLDMSTRHKRHSICCCAQHERSTDIFYRDARRPGEEGDPVGRDGRRQGCRPRRISIK